MATLATFTRLIDDDFVNTWYEIRPDAIDNILDAIVVWAALRERGTFTEQVGGDIITRTIGFGEQGAVAVQKGDVLPQGEPDLDTMLQWDWRHTASHVQRSTIDDQKNNGAFRIKSYVTRRLEAARDGLEQKYEEDLFRTAVLAETGKEIQGLNDMIPPFVDRATGTYGKLARSNVFWQPKYRQFVPPKDINLVSDMKIMYNDVHNNQVAPDLIISNKADFELYEEFALDASQIAKKDNFLADLGFETLMFKGKDMVWTENIDAGDMLFLNTQFIEVVFDPQLWFDMTEFKPIPLQLERIAHIVSALNIISDQLRRHGRLFA